MYLKCQNSTSLVERMVFFSYNYWIAALSTLYLTVLGNSIPSLKSIGHFDIPESINQKARNRYA